jgi:hypothetical protein
MNPAEPERTGKAPAKAMPGRLVGVKTNFDPTDRWVFWTFMDLVDRGIITGRTDFHRKQTLLEFPRPIILTGGRNARAVYRAADVIDWVEARAALKLKRPTPWDDRNRRKAEAKR